MSRVMGNESSPVKGQYNGGPSPTLTPGTVFRVPEQGINGPTLIKREGQREHCPSSTGT